MRDHRQSTRPAEKAAIDELQSERDFSSWLRTASRKDPSFMYVLQETGRAAKVLHRAKKAPLLLERTNRGLVFTAAGLMLYSGYFNLGSPYSLLSAAICILALLLGIAGRLIAREVEGRAEQFAMYGKDLPIPNRL